MKKLAILVTIALLCGGYSNATSIQIRPILGYGFGVGQNNVIAGGPILGSDREVDSAGDTTKNKNIYYSGGAGLNMGVGILVEIEENFGVEIGLGYVLGSEKEIYKEVDNTSTPADITTMKVKSSYIPIDLTAKISTEVGELRLYAGFGPTFALGVKTTVLGEYVSGTDKEETETEFTYNTSIGWNATLGAESDLNETMTLFFGVSLRSVILRLKKSEITKYTENGVDKLNEEYPNVRDRETEYKEDSSDDDSAKTGVPRIANTWTQPFDSLSINAGIAFKF